MTRPICTRTMPGRHPQPFVHSLTKLCRHTTLVQQCLSNGRQQISQCLSYTQPESKSLCDPQVYLESGEDFKSSSNHPPPKLEEMGQDEQNKTKTGLKKMDIKEEEQCTQAKKALCLFVCYCKSNTKSFAITGFFLKCHSR